MLGRICIFMRRNRNMLSVGQYRKFVHVTVAENELVMLKRKKGRKLRDKFYPLSAFASPRLCFQWYQYE
jgi:hypothetical protein